MEKLVLDEARPPLYSLPSSSSTVVVVAKTGWPPTALAARSLEPLLLLLPPLSGVRGMRWSMCSLLRRAPMIEIGSSMSGKEDRWSWWWIWASTTSRTVSLPEFQQQLLLEVEVVSPEDLDIQTKIVAYRFDHPQKVLWRGIREKMKEQINKNLISNFRPVNSGLNVL